MVANHFQSFQTYSREDVCINNSNYCKVGERPVMLPDKASHQEAPIYAFTPVFDGNGVNRTRQRVRATAWFAFSVIW